MSRNMPWLVGLTPHAFVEIDTALAQRQGIKNGDRDGADKHTDGPAVQPRR